MIEEIKAWECKKCGRTYLRDKPPNCSCANELNAENIIGPFRLISKRNGRVFNVTCLLCGLDTEIDTSNIRRQKSCGCKPRHIELMNNTEEQVRYKCRKCGNSHVAELPILEWCCELEDEE